MFTKENSRNKSRAVPVASSLLAIAILGFVLAPILSVVLLALHSTEPIWGHLGQTVLPRYLGATFRLMLGVAVLAGAMGAGAAWIVTMYRFPGRGWLSGALVLPMAIPAYVAAYAMVDVLDYSGILQTGLRAVMGWTGPRDYWFFEVRSEAMAILVLSSVLYPYVYLLVRAALTEQSGNVFETARSLGLGRWGVFWRLGLPIARPALATGVALALMETVADFGTVTHFGVQTLTTGIFTTWLSAGNVGGAAQLALFALVLILGLTAMEQRGRARARYFRPARAARPVPVEELRGAPAMLALALCLLPFTLGFVLPVLIMLGLGMAHLGAAPAPGLMRALWHSLSVGAMVSVLTVGLAIALVHALRRSGTPVLLQRLAPVSRLGYAAPGAVLAVGVLMPLAFIDHAIAGALESLFGGRVGLLLTGTSLALVLACSIRFFGVAQGAVESAAGRIPPSLSQAARSLGETDLGALGRVRLPLMRRSILLAVLLIFVDTIKELPATLLLRPFNYETLATRTYELVSLERLEQAAPAALVIILLGVIAVWVMVRVEARDGKS